MFCAYQLNTVLNVNLNNLLKQYFNDIVQSTVNKTFWETNTTEYIYEVYALHKHTLITL